MFLFFDFETTGVNQINSSESFQALLRKQRAIQLAWIIVDRSYNHEATKNFYISGNKEINEEFHKSLSTDFLNENGHDPKIVLEKFLTDIQYIRSIDGLLIGHNIDFDLSILRNEIVSLDMMTEDVTELLDYFDSPRHHYCTMKQSIDLCKLPKVTQNLDHLYKKQYLGYKYPKLIELYRYLFLEDPREDLHDALNDTEVTRRCFIRLASN